MCNLGRSGNIGYLFLGSLFDSLRFCGIFVGTNSEKLRLHVFGKSGIQRAGSSDWHLGMGI